MDIFSVFTLCGGLAFFLYGMTVMSKSLEKMAGGKLERMLKRMTSNPIKSLLLGAGITIAIQSSSAMTVMLVGLVNSGVHGAGADHRGHHGLQHRHHADGVDPLPHRHRERERVREPPEAGELLPP